MNIFDTPGLNLEKIGHIRNKKSAEIKSSIFSIGFECLDRKLFNPDKCFDRAAELGVKWARVQTNWNLCETKKGQYDFAGLDHVIDELLRRGIQPWMSIVFGNPLYMPDVPHPAAVGFVPTEYGIECRTAWIDFIRACVTHCRNRVRWWEVWNEPNMAGFWHPGEPSGAKYAELVALAEQAVHSIDPEARIVGCMSGNHGEFISDAAEEGIGTHISAFAIHPYFAEEMFDRRLNRLRRVFERAGCGDLPIWQGECGYPAQPYFHKDATWYKLYHATETTQAKWIVRRMTQDLASGMGMSSYFHIADLLEGVYWSATGGEKYPTMLGLLKTLDYLPKEAFYAMRNLTPFLDGNCTAEPMELEVSSDSYSAVQQGLLPLLGIRSQTFLRRNMPVYSWYYAEDVQREFVGLTDVQIGIVHEAGGKIVQPVLLDPLSGNVYRVTELEYQKNSAWIHRLPMTDYPIFLTDRSVLEME